LEKLGPKYRLALRTARDERNIRLKCDHKGVYADNCKRIVESFSYFANNTSGIVISHQLCPPLGVCGIRLIVTGHKSQPKPSLHCVHE
jgi:hypothetical protein